MHLVYDESAKGSRSPVPFEQWNANRNYLNHYGNLLYLEFIAKQSDKFAEKRQAEKELTICRRKLEFWKRHPNWDQAALQIPLQTLKKQWRN